MQNAYKKINLIEDHHEAYYLWQKAGIRSKALVHLDAHVDFGFHDVKPPEQIFKEATSKEALKHELERLLLFKKFQFSEEKLTNIGNYIYPAIRDGIVNKFWWVIPGDAREFRKSLKSLKRMLKNFIRMDPYKNTKIKINGSSISAVIYNIPFQFTTLDGLSEITEPTLLDIDVDFLTTPSLKVADATAEIGKREPWLYPEGLIKVINDKIRSPLLTTVAYSVNGGFTPMKYKFLGDEIGFRLENKVSPEAEGIFGKRQKARLMRDWVELEDRLKHYNGFRANFKNKFLADAAFNNFMICAKKELYNNAVRLNPSYKARDNNYGPLFLAKRKTGYAGKEFKKILNADKGNIFARAGLGDVYLTKRQFLPAVKEFKKILGLKPDFNEALLGLGMAEFRLKNYEMAEKSFLKYEATEKPNANTRYCLARIYEQKGDFRTALEYYKNAMQLGSSDAGIILRIAKILKKSRDEDTRKFIIARYGEIKKYVHKPAMTREKTKRLKTEKRVKAQIKAIGKILKDLNEK